MSNNQQIEDKGPEGKALDTKTATGVTTEHAIEEETNSLNAHSDGEAIDTEATNPEIQHPASNHTDEAINDIFAKLETLESLFKKRLLYDEGKEKILDKLHSELQDYKSDLYFKLTNPLFYDIIVVLDDIRKMKSGASQTKQLESDSVLEFSEFVEESLLYLLDKYEVLPFSSDINSKFDAVKQRMVRTEATDDPALTNMVAESIFTGFTQRDRLIFPEKVAVYKLEKTTTEEN